jgi:hypothetical protein
MTLRVRAFSCCVLSRVVSHDINNISAMTARMVAMSVLLRSSNSHRQVLALAVANHYFRLMSTTRTVAVAQIRRAHDRK